MHILYHVFSFLARLSAPKLSASKIHAKELLVQTQQLIENLHIRQADMHKHIASVQADLEANRALLQQKILLLQQMEEAGSGKDIEIRLLSGKIEQMQVEIANKDSRIDELTQINSHLEEKLNQLFSDLSSSIHLN